MPWVWDCSTCASASRWQVAAHRRRPGIWGRMIGRNGACYVQRYIYGEGFEPHEYLCAFNSDQLRSFSPTDHPDHQAVSMRICRILLEGVPWETWSSVHLDGIARSPCVRERLPTPWAEANPGVVPPARAPSQKSAGRDE